MGDIGRFDGDGRLWFLGRKAHRLQTERGVLFPVPLENAFNVCGEVHRTALVGVGENTHERPHLIVELEPGARRAAVEARLSRRSSELAEAASIEGFLFHKSFPVDVRHNAKIRRLELKRWAEQELASKGR
jgi:acyl-coenzyme A synthetase/AMP-(fatty) acid ligase